MNNEEVSTIELYLARQLWSMVLMSACTQQNTYYPQSVRPIEQCKGGSTNFALMQISMFKLNIKYPIYKYIIAPKF